MEPQPEYRRVYHRDIREAILYGNTISNWSRWHLNLGCGTGRFGGLLESSTLDVIVSVDINREFLKVVNKRYNPVCADARYLPFRDSVFSSIIAIQLFGIFPQIAVSINEIYYVLQVKGILVATFVRYHTPYRLIRRHSYRMDWVNVANVLSKFEFLKCKITGIPLPVSIEPHVQFFTLLIANDLLVVCRKLW